MKTLQVKKIVLFIFLGLLFSGTAFAQKDKKAKEILDKSSETFSQAGGVKAGFTINMKDIKDKVTESFDGTILMKGDKFYLTTPDFDLWFNGTVQWFYMKRNEEVTVSEPTKEELQMLNPAVLLNIYKLGFNYKYIGEKTDIKGRPVHELHLIPQKKTDVQKMIIQIGKFSNLPHTITIENKNDIHNIIHINQYETKQNYTDSRFSFDSKKFPDVEVIDLRD